MNRALRLTTLLALMGLAGGCSSVGYYAQAVKGHCQIVTRQRSCEKLLADTKTPAELRAKLELARDLCGFAEQELALPAHGAYRRYADLNRPFVVWNVYAAPAFSLEAKTWWYPFVGSLDYRGYFSEHGARRCADLLAAKGFDVHVEGVEAYSTLGWFNDPLLNTFMHHSEPILAEVLFHELAHQKVFASGDTDFNEAFATVVSRAGVRRWLLQRGDPAALERYEAAVERDAVFAGMVQSARQELKQLYAGPSGQRSAEALEAAKQEVLESLQRRFVTLTAQAPEYQVYAEWFESGMNNAKLNSVATYHELVPAFTRLLADHGGRLEPFYASVKALTRLPDSRRQEELVAESSKTERQASGGSPPGG